MSSVGEDLLCSLCKIHRFWQTEIIELAYKNVVRLSKPLDEYPSTAKEKTGLTSNEALRKSQLCLDKTKGGEEIQ